MDTRYGKLTLLKSDGPEVEFELAKPNISLGRSTANDITLDDVSVSRSHGLLECNSKGITLIDLGIKLLSTIVWSTIYG